MRPSAPDGVVSRRGVVGYAEAEIYEMVGIRSVEKAKKEAKKQSQPNKKAKTAGEEAECDEWMWLVAVSAVLAGVAAWRVQRRGHRGAWARQSVWLSQETSPGGSPSGKK